MRALQLTVLALVGVGLLAPPAGAQEGEAFITVDQAHPAPGSTHYFVSVTDAEGEPVSDTEVTATPISPDGEEGETVTFESSGDGVYQGPVAMNDPGEWTVRFESEDPPGTTEATQMVSAAQTPIESVPTDADADGNDATASEEDDDSSSALPLILLLGGLAAVAALAVVLFLRGAPDETPTATPDADTTPAPDTTPPQGVDKTPTD